MGVNVIHLFLDSKRHRFTVMVSINNNTLRVDRLRNRAWSHGHNDKFMWTPNFACPLSCTERLNLQKKSPIFRSRVELRSTSVTLYLAVKNYLFWIVLILIVKQYPVPSLQPPKPTKIFHGWRLKLVVTSARENNTLELRFKTPAEEPLTLLPVPYFNTSGKPDRCDTRLPLCFQTSSWPAIILHGRMNDKHLIVFRMVRWMLFLARRPKPVEYIASELA